MVSVAEVRSGLTEAGSRGPVAVSGKESKSAYSEESDSFIDNRHRSDRGLAKAGEREGCGRAERVAGGGVARRGGVEW